MIYELSGTLHFLGCDITNITYSLVAFNDHEAIDLFINKFRRCKKIDLLEYLDENQHRYLSNTATVLTVKDVKIIQKKEDVFESIKKELPPKSVVSEGVSGYTVTQDIKPYEKPVTHTIRKKPPLKSKSVLVGEGLNKYIVLADDTGPYEKPVTHTIKIVNHEPCSD